MIIDDVRRVAFVHIPKCGGTSVGHQFGPYDSYAGRFRRTGEHPRLGAIHYAHIPLVFLREEFPEEFDKLAAYHAFAILRDPHIRFASAVCQRLETFGGLPPLTITADVALAEAWRMMDWLAARTRFCEFEYVHFSRQADYVRLDGREVVKNLFPLENMAAFAAAFEAASGLALDPERRENTNFVSTDGFMSKLRRFKPLYRHLTSWEMRKRILHLTQRLKLQTPAALYDRFREDAEISAFVERYYAEDFTILERARERLASEVPPAARTRALAEAISSS